MKRFIWMHVLLASALLAACGSPAPTPEPPAEMPAALVESAALVDSVEIEVISQDPARVNAIARGHLPDAGCTSIASVEQEHVGDTLQITLVTFTDPEVMCAQVLTPFEEVAALDISDLPAGAYTITVNGISSTLQLPLTP